MHDIAQLESRLALDDPEEERLAHHAPTLDALSGEERERIARVAYRISQIEAERCGKVIPSQALKPWREMTARERVEGCATVYRIVQAMVRLGWIEGPGPLA